MERACTRAGSSIWLERLGLIANAIAGIVIRIASMMKKLMSPSSSTMKCCTSRMNCARRPCGGALWTGIESSSDSYSTPSTWAYTLRYIVPFSFRDGRLLTVNVAQVVPLNVSERCVRELLDVPQARYVDWMLPGSPPETIQVIEYVEFGVTYSG